MPSPFPGMDPYVEHPVIFPDFHDSLIIYIREAIQPVLPEHYFAATADRVWVELSERRIGPDVKVLHHDAPTITPERELQMGGIATEVEVEPVVVSVPHDEIREPFLEIYASIPGERLVASIEVLSLANKTPGAHGRDLYLQKQREILQSQVHLVEIDLLRSGEHSTAVPLDRALPKTGPFEYHVCLHRFDSFEKYFVYPIRLEDRLPVIRIPLLPGDGDVKVDLQAVLLRCYDTGPYRRRIDYGAQPLPPLDETRWAWAKRLLAERK